MSAKFTQRNHGNFECAICRKEYPKAQHNQIVCPDCRSTKKKLNNLERKHPEKYPRRARPEMSKADMSRYIDPASNSPCLDCAFLADCKREIWSLCFDPYCAPLTWDGGENWRHAQYQELYTKNAIGSWSVRR